MKKISTASVISLCVAIISLNISEAQSIAINTDGSTANPSAILDIKSTNKGLLAPRMTQTQRNLITNPAAGLMIYQTDNTSGYYFYDGSAWTQLATGSVNNLWSVNGTNVYNNNATQSVAINTDGSIASSSAILDIKSATKGMLIPRVALTSTTDNTTITSATISLLIYNTAAIGDGATAVTPGYYYWTGSAWDRFATGSANNIWTQDGTNIYNSNSGMVGIGTSNYHGKLTVQSATNNFGLVHTDGNIRIGTWVGGLPEFAGGWLGTISNHPLHFFTSNSSPQMTLLQNGNVGIGKHDPTATLDVARGNGLEGNAIFRGTTYFSSFNYGGFIGKEDTYIRGGINGSNVIINDLLKLGNVGIGTDVPADKLTVRTSDAKYGFTHTTGATTVGSYIGNGAGWLGTKSNSPLNFFTNDGNAQMVINTDGQVSINGQLSINPGTGILNSKLSLNNGDLYLNSIYGHNWRVGLAIGPTESLLYFDYHGDTKAFVDGDDGDWHSLSDASLKENISPYKSVLDDIKNIRVSTYRYKSNGPNSRSFGLIAQNVAEYFPEIVSATQDKEGHKLLGIAYGKTGVIALKAIQEQQVIIEKQQQQIDLLLKRIEALERK